MRSPTGLQHAHEGAEHRLADGHEDVRIRNALEALGILQDLSSTHVYQRLCRVPARGCERRLRRKSLLLNIVLTTAAKPCGPNLKIERGLISDAKRRASSIVNSPATRLVRSARAEITSAVCRSNLFSTSSSAGSRSRARVVGFARVKMFSDARYKRITFGYSTRAQGKRICRRADGAERTGACRFCKWRRSWQL